MDESALKILLDNLDKSKSSLDGWLTFWTWLVVIGVIAELAFVIHEYHEDLGGWRRGIVWPPDRPSRIWFVFELAAVALVAAGVAGELLVESKIGAVETQIREANDRRALLLQKEAGDAIERAAQADLKRVELEDRIVDIFGPRQLTTEQSARIAAQLVGLAGAKVDVFVFALGNPYTPADFSDSLNVTRAVVRTLRAAHIDAEGWLLESCQGGAASNLVVSVSGDNNHDREIASQLIAAFRPEIGTYPEIGMYTPSLTCAKFSGIGTRPNKGKHDAAISITIGRKINPLLTREMLEPSGTSEAKR